jgi:hypothetical protein
MNDIIEVYDVTFTKSEVEPGIVYAMHDDITKTFRKADGWCCPQLRFEAETTQQAKAQYVMMHEAGQIKVVDDAFK